MNPQAGASTAAPAIVKVKHSVRPLAEIIKARGTERRAAYIVEGLIAENSVNIGVGDSGLGKSPLAYQMGLCVAAGTEFLGRTVKQGPVIYADLENGEDQFTEIGLALQRHLKLTEIPPGLHVLTEREDCYKLEAIIAEIKPVLVIIDSLRAFSPGAEKDNEEAAKLLNRLRDWAKKYGTSFLLLHHIKKTIDEGNIPHVENADVMSWLTLACGARALVNQTDTRIAFGPCFSPPEMKDNAQEITLRDSVGLVMRWFERGRGQSAPVYLSRCMDEHGEPIGYEAMTGPDLLFNEQMKKAWLKLPRGTDIGFTLAKETYGKQAPATRNWLEKCIAVGIVKQAGKGMPYRVVEPAG